MKIKTARDRAWKACSIYIRTKYSVGGQVQCVSCGTWNSIKETDAGHFLPKSRSNALRFVEQNIHPQCQHCNRFDPETSKTRYTKFMQDTYGQEIIDELLLKSRRLKRWRVAELLEVEAEYKERLKDLNSSIDETTWEGTRPTRLMDTS